MDSTSDPRLAPVLVEFAQTLGTDFSVQRILDHLVRRIVDILPVTGAGVMLMGGQQELHFLAASNEAVLVIEGLQNELGEGPCLEAYRTGEAVAVIDLRSNTRFPRFSSRAWADGLAAVFTFPLRLEDERLGALDLYRDTPGALNEQDQQSGQLLADVAAAYLVNAQARIDTSASVAQLNHRSLHDPLTGLPNRTLLEELLEQAVARARRSRHAAAILFADLDGFKAVNDRYGHHIGDQLLCDLAVRMSEVLRPGDTLARLGGDEFVVLCEDLHDDTEAKTVAARVIDAVSQPFRLSGHTITLTVSVGIAFAGPGQDIPAALLATPTSPCTRQRAGAGVPTRSWTPAPGLLRTVATTWNATCCTRRNAPSSRCSTSPSSTSTPGVWRLWRRCCAGTTRSAGRSAPTSSSRWPSGRASSWAWATGCFAGRARTCSCGRARA